MSEKISVNWCELSPAYGRDYKSKRDVEQDFRQGKDFVGDHNIGFQLCSIADFAPGVTVNLRYKKLTQVTPVKV